ncbi:MAG: MBL fold metallo-hydrolase [Planctomycetota bacterium]
MKYVVALSLLMLFACSVYADVIVQTYASPALDVDAVNTHLIETDAGVIVFDTQRLLPEAERVVRLIGDRPVLAVIVSHGHSDHYGGLPVFAERFPEAPRYAAEQTLRDIVDDPAGFNVKRRQRHGERFPTQPQLTAAAPDRVLTDGETLEIGSEAFEVVVLGPSHAADHAVVYHAASGSLFTGDMVVNGFIPNAFVDLDAMIRQLDEITQRFPDTRTIYPGHGPPGPAEQLLASQRAYLVQIRDLVSAALADGVVNEAEKQHIVFTLETDHPHRLGAAGNDRRTMLGKLINRVAAQQLRPNHQD